ncbi:amine oxidase [flavin-containing] B-like [Glandiceps talaboti]
MGERQCDIVVIGAGISGLSAAKLLSEEGLDVLVVEARDRVGGRLYTVQDPAFQYSDMGGSYIGPTQNRIYRLAKEVGVESYKVNVKEKTILRSGSTKMKYRGTIPPIYNPLVAMDVNNLMRTIDDLADTIPLSAPWKCPKAKEWDSITTKEWVDKACWSKFTRGIAQALVRAVYAVEPEELSFLHFLWYIKSGDGIMRITSTKDGGQERKFIGGTQPLCEKVADTFGKDRVILNSPVMKVEEDEEGISVCTSDMVYKSKFVICAISPALIGRMAFSPPLSPQKIQLIQRVPMGSVVKTVMFYDRTFWREKGFCGMVATDGLVSAGFDDTKPDGSHPAIIGLVTGQPAREMSLLTKDERKRRLCEFYADLFETDEFLKPINYIDHDWLTEQYSGGCYTGIMPPGVLTQFGSVMREPHGNIFFAGTETATEWSGYMEGGIQAGERAAREILCAMGKISEDEIWQDEPEAEDMPAVSLELSKIEKMLPSPQGFLNFMMTSIILITGVVLVTKNPGMVDVVKDTVTGIVDHAMECFKGK